MQKHPGTIYFFSFLLAFCSLFYEYALAQVLSVCLGGTTRQYLIVISIFTFSLGLGSIAQYYLAKRFGLRKVFLTVEVLLVLFGASSPFFIALILGPQSFIELDPLKILLSYGMVFLIGLFSGFEIPSLFALAPSSQGKVLGFDYLGMLGASVIFPFFLLPILGTGAGTLFVANLNICFLIWYGFQNKRSSFKAGLYLVNILLGAGIIFYKMALNHFLSSIYLGAI